MGSNPVAVIQNSDIAPVSSKVFLDIQAATNFRLTVKTVRYMIITYN